MKKEAMQKILLHLKNKDLLDEAVPLTEDELVDKLYVNNDERKGILKALLSLFSEDYRTDFQRTNAQMLDNEIAHKMYELEFVSKERRIDFVVGKCSKEDQQAVYEKMFRALYFALIAQEESPNKFSSSLLTENLPEQGIQLSVNRLKKLSKKKFDLKQAKQNLEVARKTLADASQFMAQQKHQQFQQSIQQKLKVPEDEESKLSELSNTVETFKSMMEGCTPLSPLSSSQESQAAPAELGSAVSELHRVLQFVDQSTKSSPSEGLRSEKKFDLEKMLAQAKELEKNSIVAKCFSKDT